MQEQIKEHTWENLHRGLGKAKSDFTLVDMYISYLESIEVYKEKKPDLYLKLYRTKEEWLGLVQQYLDGILDCVFKGEIFDIPYSLGILYIQKKKMPVELLASSHTGLKIDFNESRKAKKKIFHLNQHSDFHRYRFYWRKGRFVRGSYSFTPVRANARKLAKIIKSGHQDYFN